VEDRYISSVKTRQETQCQNKKGAGKMLKLNFISRSYNIDINIISNIKYIIINNKTKL
jgi:hypothetical protein